jgi:hypothetical protein
MARRRKGDPEPSGDRKTFYRQNIDKTNEVIAEQVAIVKEEIDKWKKEVLAGKKNKKKPKDKSLKQKAALPEAYIKSGCNKAQAARMIGVRRRKIADWISKDDELRQIMEDIDESLLDMSESALMTHIVEGNPIANLFHLKTKGRKRGYIEQPRGGASEGGTSFSDGLEMVREQIKNNPRLMKKIEEVLTD